MKYELIIIGGGPAGVSAGVYAGRKLLKTLLIAPEFGGQSVVSDDIQNWIGTPHIHGAQLAKDLESKFKVKASISIEFEDLAEDEKEQAGLPPAKLLPVPGGR